MSLAETKELMWALVLLVEQLALRRDLLSLAEMQELTWVLASLVVQLEWRRDLLLEENRNRSWLWCRWLSIGLEEGFSRN